MSTNDSRRKFLTTGLVAVAATALTKPASAGKRPAAKPPAATIPRPRRPSRSAEPLPCR